MATKKTKVEVRERAAQDARDLAFLLHEQVKIIESESRTPLDDADTDAAVARVNRTRLAFFSTVKADIYEVQRARRTGLARALEIASEIVNLDVAVTLCMDLLRELHSAADEIEFLVYRDAIRAWRQGRGARKKNDASRRKWDAINDLAQAIDCGATTGEALRVEIEKLAPRRKRKP